MTLTAFLIQGDYVMYKNCVTHYHNRYMPVCTSMFSETIAYLIFNITLCIKFYKKNLQICLLTCIKCDSKMWFGFTVVLPSKKKNT